MSTGIVSITANLGVWEIVYKRDGTGRVVQVDYSTQVSEGVRRHDAYRPEGHYRGTTYELEGDPGLYDRYGRTSQRDGAGSQS